jgi:hypothetical protein
MQPMENRPGAATMSERMRKIARLIVDGLVWSARATAWREGLPWEPEEGRARAERPEDHQ